MVRTPAQAVAVILFRRVPELEVYWVHRSDGLNYLGGFHAFPGGRATRADSEAPVTGAREGLTGAQIACGAREVFEETGVLLCRGARRVPRERRERLRSRLLEDATSLAEGMREESLGLESSDFTPAGRWISPPFTPSGFDTQFLLVELPEGEEPSIWPGELQGGEWIRPAEGLARWASNQSLCVAPILHILRSLAAHPDGTPSVWEPILSAPPEAQGGAIPRIEMHPGFLLVPLRSPTLLPATHTNCLVIGGPEVLVVDPGSPEPEEQERLQTVLEHMLAEGRTIRGILVTHHHHDHVAGVEPLRKRFGVPVYAHRWTAPYCRADVPLEGDEVIELAPDGARRWDLKVLFTPGHTPGHVALYEAESGTIVAGDLVSGLGTVVIDPPEGDMRAYLESLARLLELPATLILPGHGPPTGGPAHRLRFYLEHRRWREERILQSLAGRPRRVEDIVPEVYDDTPVERHGLAARSALAHLEKLRAEGRVTEPEPGVWAATESVRSERT